MSIGARQVLDDPESDYPGRLCLLLPLSSELPVAAPEAVAAQGEAVLRASMSVRWLADRVRGTMLSRDALVRQIEWTASGVGVLARGVPTAPVTIETSEVEGSVEYDRYFGFRRVAAVSADVLAVQIVTACHAVLVEISRSAIGIDEVTAALDTVGDLLVWCATVPGTEKVICARPAPRPVEGEPLERRAEYRWVLGHHLFNLASLFCLNEIRRASRHALGVDADGTAEALRSAARFLRATTAAMWLASNIPASVYLEHIRPAMAAHSGDEEGFSGTQNLDYFRLRRAVTELRTILRSASIAATTAVRLAHDVFTEVEIQDVEHHILIAAAKVGGAEPSLLTHASRMNLPEHVAMVPAVEMLRDLAALRRSNREHRS